MMVNTIMTNRFESICYIISNKVTSLKIHKAMQISIVPYGSECWVPNGFFMKLKSVIMYYQLK